MIETLIYKAITNIEEVQNHASSYAGKPCVFYQQLPHDRERQWNSKEMFPRIIYNVDWVYNPERKTDGKMAVDIYCTNENSIGPEELGEALVAELSELFLTDRSGTYCLVWDRSDSFDIEGHEPLISGLTISFDVIRFPKQEGAEPCPIWSVNQFIKAMQPPCILIGHDTIPERLRATAKQPIVYVRRTDTRIDPKKSTYAMAWMQTDINISVISSTVEETRQWTAAIQRDLAIEQETVMQNGSPYLIMKIAENSSNEPLKTGQLLLTGQYGVMRRAKDTTKLNNVHFKKEG